MDVTINLDGRDVTVDLGPSTEEAGRQAELSAAERVAAEVARVGAELAETNSANSADIAFPQRNYRPTFAAAIADVAVGDTFTTDDGVPLAWYRRTSTTPFYEFIALVATGERLNVLAQTVADVADLAALDTSLFTKADLNGATWVFSGNILTTQVKADIYGGMYVAPDIDPNAYNGAWVRQRNGDRFTLEQFGILTDLVDRTNIAAMAARVAHNDPRNDAMCRVLSLVPGPKELTSIGERWDWGKGVPFYLIDDLTTRGIVSHCANPNAGPWRYGSIHLSTYGAPNNQSIITEAQYNLMPIAVGDQEVTFASATDAAKYRPRDPFLAVNANTYDKNGNTRWIHPYWARVKSVSGAVVKLDRQAKFTYGGTPKAIHVNSGDATHPILKDADGNPEKMRMASNFASYGCILTQAAIDETTGNALTNTPSAPFGTGGCFGATLQGNLSDCFIGLTYGNMWVDAFFEGNVVWCAGSPADLGYLSSNVTWSDHVTYRDWNLTATRDPLSLLFLNEGSIDLTMNGSIDWRGGPLTNVMTLGGGARHIKGRTSVLLDAQTVGLSAIAMGDESASVRTNNLTIRVEMEGAATFDRALTLNGFAGTQGDSRENNNVTLIAPQIVPSGNATDFVQIVRQPDATVTVELDNTLVSQISLEGSIGTKVRGSAQSMTVVQTSSAGSVVEGKFNFAAINAAVVETPVALIVPKNLVTKKVYADQVVRPGFVPAIGSLPNNSTGIVVTRAQLDERGAGVSFMISVSGGAATPILHGVVSIINARDGTSKASARTLTITTNFSFAIDASGNLTLTSSNSVGNSGSLQWSFV